MKKILAGFGAGLILATTLSVFAINYSEMGFNSIKAISQSNTTVDLWDNTLGGLKATLVSLISGERNPSSGTNSYLVNRAESNGTVVSNGTTAKTISSAPAHLQGVYISAALTGTLTIAGLTDETGTAANVVMPAATPAGFYNFGNARCETSLIVTKSSASDNGLITVLWRPI